MKNKPIWIRIAGNRENLRSGKPQRWRCSIDGHVIDLTHWSLRGSASTSNNIPGTNPEGDESGFIAWIDYYGEPQILREELTISLREPPPEDVHPTLR